MPKFTKGPWEYSRMHIGPKEKDRRSGFVVNGPEIEGPHLPVRICDMRTAGDKGFGECEANARLIAKAPEMHELLSEIAAQQDINDVSDEWDQSSEWRCKWCGWEYTEADETESGDMPELCTNPECAGVRIRKLLAEIEG